MRMGIGYDIHRFAEGRKLLLGGVEIPYIAGLLGHSDADVVLHALCDAILGALGKGDIGQHFPNTDSHYKDISSLELLKSVEHVMRDDGYAINNIDIIIISEDVKIDPFRSSMRQSIATALGLDINYVNIKATTSEGVGAIGRNEAIASYAAVTIDKRNN